MQNGLRVGLHVVLALAATMLVAVPLFIMAHRLLFVRPEYLGRAQFAIMVIAGCAGALIIGRLQRGWVAWTIAVAYFGVSLFMLTLIGIWVEGHFFGNFL